MGFAPKGHFNIANPHIGMEENHRWGRITRSHGENILMLISQFSTLLRNIVLVNLAGVSLIFAALAPNGRGGSIQKSEPGKKKKKSF